MALNVFISHSTSPWELAQVYSLANETKRQGLNVYIPDRTWYPADGLPNNISTALSQTAIFVLFATSAGHHLDWVNTELRSLPQGKPAIAIVEPGIQLQNFPPQEIIWFNRENPGESIGLALQRLQSLNLSRQIGNLVAAFLVGSLALLILRGLPRRD